MVPAIVALLLALKLTGELILQAVNRSEVRRRAPAPPPGALEIMDRETFAKSVEYTLVKSRFGSVAEVFDTLLLAVAVFSGLLPWLHGVTSGWASPGAVWDDAAFVLLAGAALSLPGLPFDWWEKFRIEERFGFNKGGPGLWVADKAKGLALTAAIGFPLLWILLVLVRFAGPAWWVWGFALMFGFQLLMIVLYPKLILPLFNKLTPLPDGDLRSQLMELADRTGFHARTIEVIDGSRRSGHSNAFFTGFGRFRRIVLYDTLLAQLDSEQIKAVLAHEIGHYRLGHVPRMLAVGAASQLAAFAVVGWLMRSDWFNPAFGFAPGEAGPAFLLFGLLGGVATFWLTPLTNALSRRHEYQADAFARRAMNGAEAMIGALRRLAQKNLSNLTPHPIFSAFHYSHPTLLERERALKAG